MAGHECPRSEPASGSVHYAAARHVPPLPTAVVRRSSPAWRPEDLGLRYEGRRGRARRLLAVKVVQHAGNGAVSDADRRRRRAEQIRDPGRCDQGAAFSYQRESRRGGRADQGASCSPRSEVHAEPDP
ncbi:hypothetical protein HBB16_21275 [Pseudonocardia sp. MCCB 268]|nr:hypothetical protein [Pseudonocardia cytotoxica]